MAFGLNDQLFKSTIKKLKLDCCKSEGVPRLCHWSCVPGGAIPTGRKKLRCSKHVKEMYKCKKGESYIRNSLGYHNYNFMY